MRIGDISGDDVGRYVEVRGTVQHLRATRSGGASLDLVDLGDFALLSVFLDRGAWSDRADPMAVRNGALVLARGALESWATDVVLSVARGEDLSVLHAPGDNARPAREIASAAPGLVGYELTARGVLGSVRPVHDWDMVSLSAGGLSVWAHAPEGREGLVDACGVWDRDPVQGRWLLVAEPLLPHPSESDCEAVGIVALLEDPEAHAGRRLVLRRVLAERGEFLGTAFELEDGPYRLSGFQRDRTELREGSVATFTGTLEFSAKRGRYELVSSVPTLRPG